MVVLKCCGKELTKRVLSTLSPVLAQCGLNLPKVSKKKILLNISSEATGAE
jgi:hypothetical protein